MHAIRNVVRTGLRDTTLRFDVDVNAQFSETGWLAYDTTPQRRQDCREGEPHSVHATLRLLAIRIPLHDVPINVEQTIRTLL